MLADQQAEMVAEARLTVVVAVVSVRGRRTVIRIGQGRKSRGDQPSSSTEQRPMP